MRSAADPGPLTRVFSRRDASGRLQAFFRLAVVVTHSIGPAQVQLDVAVGGVQLGGVLRNLDRLLILLAPN